MLPKVTWGDFVLKATGQDRYGSYTVMVVIEYEVLLFVLLKLSNLSTFNALAICLVLSFLKLKNRIASFCFNGFAQFRIVGSTNSSVLFFLYDSHNSNTTLTTIVEKL